MKLLLHLQENLEYFIYYDLIYRQSSNWLKSNLNIRSFCISQTKGGGVEINKERKEGKKGEGKRR